LSRKEEAEITVNYGGANYTEVITRKKFVDVCALLFGKIETELNTF
jgi:hypothetical protein